MINSLPTIYEAVTGTAKRESKEKTPKITSKSNKSGSKSSRQSEPNPKVSKMQPPKHEDSEEEDQHEDQDAAVCGACFQSDGQDLFWICCDICEKWFHGTCVKITPAKAEHIKQYKCPSCSTSSKRARY